MTSILRQFVLLLVLLALFSCISEPVPINLSAYHPANPQAPETTFSPPSNPFQSDGLPAVLESNHESKMSHEAHGSSSDGSQKDHQMEPKKHESGETNPSPPKKTGHQHKENNQ